MLQDFIEEQKLVCEEFDSAYIKVSEEDVIALATQTLTREPIVGLRKKPADDGVAWFIYGGELEEGEDFFETMTVRELEKILPEVVPYLALEEGFRFMIDRDDYEDIWKAEQI
ncbi:immunity protein Imm33 domain-containing protein [Acinetobacter sp. WZC-1]|uniref:immunity protein Imm33 domain-containing protein n=1 Tax=Acinetobacter sp. WZC-1 TaxID=3459034 RepID=UPI00403E1E18